MCCCDEVELYRIDYINTELCIYNRDGTLPALIVMALSQMVQRGLDLRQNVRSGLVFVITLGLWVRLDNLSLL